MVLLSFLCFVSAFCSLAVAQPSQSPLSSSPAGTHAAKEDHILSILSTHDDPIKAMLAYDPSTASLLAEPRLLQIMGGNGRGEEMRWLTEGDKMRLKREGVDWIDLTGRTGLVEADHEAKPNLPEITHQGQVRKAISHLSTTNMFEMLEVFTSYYNRLYTSQTGVDSQRWLFDEILDIIRKAPPTCHLSVEQFPHSFPTNSIIARFSPSGRRNVSRPVTILSAHIDSVNHYFPLLDAPGADDDGSGTATILEAFRVLVNQGYEPVRGPVEFHFYAGEEAGLLGSMDIAEDYQSRGIVVGGVLNVDETAFVRFNSTPAINLITVGGTKALNEWVHELAREYVDIDVKYSGMIGRGLDHQAWTKHGYPAVSIVEGDQAEGGWLPFPHTVMDRTEIPSAVGEFSYVHMKEFAKVVVAFAIEQAGMVDRGWRPSKPVVMSE